MLFALCSIYTIGAIPGNSALAHVGKYGAGSQNTSQVLSIGAGLPPVPFKLVRLGNSSISQSCCRTAWE